jgi:hypothetical protein
MNEERTGKWLRQVEHIRGLFGTQIFRNCQPSHRGDRKIVEVMTSKWVEPCLLQILGNQTEKNKSSK